jgi:hypothetical protein
MAKMKTNQDGGSYSAKKSSAPAKELAANQKGAAKGMDHKKGAADYSVGKGSHDHPHGASRMGYSQSFGPARVNSYAKGAAKVQDIMTNGGAAKHKPGHKDPVSGFGTAYADARKAGKSTFDFDGKPYSTMSKEEAESDLQYGNQNISNFEGNSPKHNASHYKTGKDTGNYEYAKYMGYTNKQIGENVDHVINTQKNAAHALGRGKEATTFKNPFK